MFEVGKGGAPTPFVNAFSEPAIGSLRYNTSQQGQPLPIIYGTQRVTINVLELWDFNGAGSKGGKGGAIGKSGGKKAATYSVYTAFGICQGPAAFTGAQHGSGGENRIWANDGIAYGPGAVGLNAYGGTDGQAPDSTFVAKDPNSPVIGYSGTCYVTGTPLQLGQAPTLPNVSFEITGFFAGTIGGSFPDDARPSDIIVDICTNARYGAGFPAANIDSAGTLTDFGNYCQAAGLAMSMILDRCQPAARWIEEICELAVAAPFWAGALFKVVPYAVSPYSGYSGSWTPNLTVQYSISDRDLIDWGGDSDPIITTRSDPTLATNWLALEYLNSSNSYNSNISSFFDQGAIDSVAAETGGPGVRNESAKEAHSFTNLVSSNASATIQVQRKQNVRNTYKFQLGWVFALLDPMDIIELTDVNAGLDNSPVRITSVSENDNGELSFEAEEIPTVVSSTPVFSMTPPSSQTPNIFIDPGDANSPIIFEPNAPLSSGINQAWICASGGANWGGCNVLVSTDGTTYAFTGTLYTGLKQGVLDATLSAYSGANPDTVNTLSADLTESEGSLMSASSSDAATGVTLCYCDGELLSYETATLTATFKYNVTTLYRGLFGTTPESHSSGSQFAYIGIQTDPIGVLKYNYNSALVGSTIYIKLQSFNEFLNSTQDASTLTPFTYTLTGAGGVNPVNVPFSFPGIPHSGTPVLNYTFGAADNFPLNLSGSVCTAGVAATADTTFDINKNGSSFGTMTILATMTTATFSGSAESFVPGDILAIVPNRTDATLANLTGNLAGTS